MIFCTQSQVRTTAVFAIWLIGLLTAVDATAKDWSFQLEPYGVAANIEGDASVGRATGADVDVDFDTILENLDLAGMIHIEAHHSNGWGMILDYAFMDLGAKSSGSRGGVVDVDVRQATLEAMVSRRFQLDDARSIDLFAGIRWWDNDVDVTIDPALLPGTVDFEVEEDWVDMMIGARWIRSLSDKWAVHLRGDIGGLGIKSEFTASASLGAHYRFNDRYTLDLQYRAVWVDYDTGTRGQPGYFEYDTVTHGPIIGLIISF